MGSLRLSKLLHKKTLPTIEDNDAVIEKLQLKMLRVQQGLWHSKGRAIVTFEGFDAAGKGGAIRALTEKLDPRGLRVHPVGPPEGDDQDKHYLYRFWKNLPPPGTLAIFDRSWYGRVLVERVEHLTPKERWKAAYREINEFEKTLVDDGIDLVKIFLAIHPETQLERFEARLRDPYKQWKLSEDDLRAHGHWGKYVEAADDLLKLTDTKHAPWRLIPADSKRFARQAVLETVTHELGRHRHWMESQIKKEHQDLEKALKKLRRMSQPGT